MFLARRELRFAWGRFALMGSVIALVGVLTVDDAFDVVNGYTATMAFEHLEGVDVDFKLVFDVTGDFTQIDADPYSGGGQLRVLQTNILEFTFADPFLEDEFGAAFEGMADDGIHLVNGETISARLVIGSSGLMAPLTGERREISKCHSVSIGFDVAASPWWPFPALTYFSEDPASRVAYFTLFPFASGWRVNMFVYRELNDPWLKQLRDDPAARFGAVPVEPIS